MTRETKEIAGQSTKLDKDTVVIFALDVDGTISCRLAAIDGDGVAENIRIAKVPKYCLSPQVIQFIRDEKNKAEKAGAICNNFLINTARCIRNEIEIVNKGIRVYQGDIYGIYEQDKEDKYKTDEKGQLIQTKGWLEWSGLQGFQLDLANFEPQYGFTFEVEKNVMAETGLISLGVSTPDDVIEGAGRTCGEAFEEARPYYEAIAKNPSYIDMPCAQFLRPIALLDLPHITLYEHDHLNKNKQIKQFASKLAKMHPGKKIIIKIIDDQNKVLDNARKITNELPENVIVELYLHNAFLQAGINPKGNVQRKRTMNTIQDKVGGDWPERSRVKAAVTAKDTITISSTDIDTSSSSTKLEPKKTMTEVKKVKISSGPSPVYVTKPISTVQKFMRHIKEKENFEALFLLSDQRGLLQEVFEYQNKAGKKFACNVLNAILVDVIENGIASDYQLLISLKQILSGIYGLSDLFIKDHNGNTPLHNLLLIYEMNSKNPSLHLEINDCIQRMLEQLKEDPKKLLQLISEKNNEGLTPAQISVDLVRIYQLESAFKKHFMQAGPFSNSYYESKRLKDSSTFRIMTDILDSLSDMKSGKVKPNFMAIVGKMISYYDSKIDQYKTKKVHQTMEKASEKMPTLLKGIIMPLVKDKPDFAVNMEKVLKDCGIESIDAVKAIAAEAMHKVYYEKSDTFLSLDAG